MSTSQSHVAGWPSDAPTAAQLKELFAQIESGRVTKDNFQVFLRDPDEEQATPTPTLLSPLYEGQEIMVGPTTGEETLASAKAVFTGYLSPGFADWGTNKPERSTQARAVSVKEMREKDATFAEIFGSLGDLDTLCLEQGEIIEFCRKHRDKLRQDGYGAFFLFKVEEQYFVAYVSVDGRKLWACVYRFAYSHVWHAAYHRRVVVPQRD